MKKFEELAQFRREYTGNELDIHTAAKNPFEQFNRWFDEAVNAGVTEPNAMTVATADKQGIPSSRVVLLKSCDENGFVFYTNYNSHKGNDLSINPVAALLFFWPELMRQIRITGNVSETPSNESDAYFNSRPLRSRIASTASPQSHILRSRTDLEEKFNLLLAKSDTSPITRPDHWGGYNVIPFEFEFWQGRPDRLHDRIQYKMTEHKWIIARLAP